MRISDWSSDVCSSDLGRRRSRHPLRRAARTGRQGARGPRPAHALEAARQARVRRGSGRERRTMNRLDVEAISAQVRALDFTRGTPAEVALRSEEHTSELQSLMRNSYAVFCLKKKKK